MSAVTFTPGTYYRCLSPITFYIQDVEDYPVAVPLGKNEVVVCEDIVFRTGGRGRGRYVKLHNRRGGRDVVLYHRVSRNNIGSGNWEELNPMIVLALAPELPTV